MKGGDGRVGTVTPPDPTYMEESGECLREGPRGRGEERRGGWMSSSGPTPPVSTSITSTHTVSGTLLPPSTKSSLRFGGGGWGRCGDRSYISILSALTKALSSSSKVQIYRENTPNLRGEVERAHGGSEVGEVQFIFLHPLHYHHASGSNLASSHNTWQRCSLFFHSADMGVISLTILHVSTPTS